MSKWSEFYTRHGQRNFTPTFNSYLDALIDDTTAEIPERVDAWILRNSWGNHSDHCADTKGAQLIQSDCARRLNVDRKEVNPVFKNRQRRGYVRFEGRAIYPIDDPEATVASATFSYSSPNVETFPTIGEEEANKTEDSSEASLSFEEFITQIWAAEHPADYQKYREVERQYKEFRMRLLNAWRAFQEPPERPGPSGDQTARNPDGNVGKVGNNLSDRSGTNGAPSYKETIKRNTAAAAAFSTVVDGAGNEQNPPPPAAPDVGPSLESEYATVTKALAESESPEPGDVRKLYAKCKRRDPLATGDEIAGEIRRMAPRWRGPGLALFLNFVPERFPLTREAKVQMPVEPESNAGAWGAELSREELERELKAETDPRLRAHIQALLREHDAKGRSSDRPRKERDA